MQFARIMEMLTNTRKYKSAVSTPWSGPPSKTSFYLLVSVAFIAVAMVANTFVRQDQLAAWESAKAITFIEDAPLFSTADAPYFLSQASAVIQDEPEHSFAKKRVFPNAIQTIAKEQETRFFGGHSLLPITIASLSSDAEIPSILKSSNRLIISSALTALLIAMCFAAAGCT